MESLELEPWLQSINLPDLNESFLIDWDFGVLKLEDVDDLDIDALLNEDEHHNEAKPATPSTSNSNRSNPDSNIFNDFDPFQRAKPSAIPFYSGGRRRAISLDQKLPTIHEEQ